MFELPILLLCIIALALVFDYTNGAHDSANAIATVVSTKVLSPKMAVTLAAVLNLAGAMMGTHVADTIGRGIVNPEMIMGCQALILAALCGAIFWNLLTWYLGLPSSSSHALIGGLIGSTIAYRGWVAVNFESVTKKILIPLFASPLAGLAMGYLIMLIVAWICVRAHPRKANAAFRKLQIISAAFMATSHGLNDAQKTMGIITLALYIFHVIPDVTVPFWVKLACAVTMGLGTMNGGWRIIKTMGHKIFKLEPIHGFAAETAASLVICSASFLGAPISTTHVISTSVMGVGASKRLSAVRWGVAGNMLFAWIITIPASGAVGALCVYALELSGLVP